MGRRFTSNGVSRAALALALCALATPTLAQEAAPSVTVEGARVFTPEDFIRFAPRNALDMLQQVPGFVIRDAPNERGLGQASANVLLNGQRIGGKTDDVATQLNRIPTSNVVRIEIVDGATVDVPGLSGQVANIITRATGISGQFAWRPEFRAHFTEPLLTRFESSVSGTLGKIEYTLGLENQASRSGAGGPTYLQNPDFTYREFREDVWTNNGEQPRISGRFVYDGPGSSVGNVNLSYRHFDYLFRERGERRGPGQTDRVRTVRQDVEGYEYEMGGDFEFALGPGRLKLIGLNKFEHEPSELLLRTDFADVTPASGIRYLTSGDESERIARAEYRWRGGNADWQLSGEAAFNSLDNIAQFFELQPNGELKEIPVGGTGRVEEARYELIGSYGRSLASNLSMQLSAGGEYSRLSQVGGGGLTRTFYRPKGQLALAWKPSPRTDVNLKIQRRVGQLNFGDFLASVNLTDDRENAGNPDLVPQQSWEVDLETIRNLGPYGTTSLRLYGQLITDIVDIIPIGETGESPGNLDRATVFGAEWKTTFNFDPLGWRGAKLDLRLQAQRTRLDDPLTGESRPISNSLIHLAEMGLRHDVPDTDWAWGGNLDYGFYALDYRLTEVGRVSEGPVWASLYVENKDVLGLTVRATVGNILGATSMWDRTVYVGRRTGPVDYYETRDRVIGPIFSFSVRGTF